MNDEQKKRKENQDKRIGELIKPYWDVYDDNGFRPYGYDPCWEIMKTVIPYVIRPKKVDGLMYVLIRDDAPEDIQLLHKYLTQMADREDWVHFDRKDMIRNPKTGFPYDESDEFGGKFLGFKYSDTYKPEMKEQGEIYTALKNDPRKIFA